MRGMIALAALLLLAGCGSSPKTHFYTLDVVRGAGGRQAGLSAPIQLAAVHIPAALDRQSMVRRTGANAVEFAIGNAGARRSAEWRAMSCRRIWPRGCRRPPWSCPVRPRPMRPGKSL